MVFDDFTKSLTDVTSKVTNTVTSPLKAVKNSVTKTVLGPNLDLVSQAIDDMRKSELQTSYRKALTRWVAAMKKVKVSVVKLTATRKALSSYEFTGETFDEARKDFKSFLKACKKQFQDGLQVVSVKEATPVEVKSKKWTATERTNVLEGFETMEDSLDETIKELKDSLPTYYTTPFTTKIDQEELMKTTKDDLEGNHDKSLDASVSLVSEWRKYIAVLRAVEKNTATIKSLKDRRVKAMPTEKKKFDAKIKEITAASKHLLSKEGKRHMTEIAKIEKEINETYKQETAILNSFSASYAELQSSLFQWQTRNSKVTDTVTKTGSTSRTRLGKASTAGKKRDEASYKKVETAVKKPYADTQRFIKTRDEQTETHNKYMGLHAEHAESVVAQLTHAEKDVSIKEKILKEHHTFTYNDSVLLRISVLFVGFANRYHKRHVSLAKEAWNKLLDLKRADSKMFAQYTKDMQKKAETYNAWIKENDARSRKDKATIDTFKKSLRQIVRLETVLDYERTWLQAAREGLTFPEYTPVLDGVYKTMGTHKKRIQKQKDQIEGAIKKTKTELKDKEKSLDIKSTRALKKEVETLHTQEENQEMYLDLFEHYLEDLSLHLSQTTDLKKGYVKAGKKGVATMKKYEKIIKTQMKKLGKSSLLKEVKWTSVLAEKSVKV